MSSTKALWNYRPDLRVCELEDRLMPAISGQGAIVPTTGGYVVVLSPFPVVVSDAFGESCGPEFPTPSVMAGSGVGYGLVPVNSAGVPGVATTAPTGSNGGAAVTMPAPPPAHRSRATPSPTTPSMPRPSSGACRGTGRPSRHPIRSIGAAYR
jgi:hypothetical protein